MNLEFLRNKNVILLGAPFAGKTTLAREISLQFGHHHIQIGDEIRKRWPDRKNSECLEYDLIDAVLQDLHIGRGLYIIDKLQGIPQLHQHSQKKYPNECVVIVRLAGPVHRYVREGREDDNLEERIRNYYQHGLSWAESHARYAYEGSVWDIYRDKNGFYPLKP